MCYAREWSQRSGNAAYVETIRALIAEETRHARDLGRFMDINGIARIRRRGPTACFASSAT
jgi:hypothetical protein